MRMRVSVRQVMIAVAAFAFGLTISPPGSPYLALLTPVALGIAALRRRSIAVPALIFLAPCAFVEILIGMPVPAWIYVPTALLISGPLWPRDLAGWRSRRLIPLVAVNALIVALYWIPWTTRKPFVRQLDSIKPGMTVAEVNRIMAGYTMGTGIPLPGSAQEFRPSGGIVFRHSEEAMFNADWGVVTFRDGKVVNVRFDPD